MTTKTVYLFDQATGESLGPFAAAASPLEPGKYFEPVCSTPTAPPAVAINQVAVFSAGTWSVVPDFRGQTAYDQTTCAPIVITNRGPLPINLGLTKSAAQLLDDAKTAQIAVLKSAYSAAIQFSVAYMATTFQADSGSQDMLTKSLVSGSVPAGFYWLDANNVQVPMTFTQLQGLAGAMLTQGQTAFAHLQTRKPAVLAAATVASVQAIVW